MEKSAARLSPRLLSPPSDTFSSPLGRCPNHRSRKTFRAPGQACVPRKAGSCKSEFLRSARAPLGPPTLVGPELDSNLGLKSQGFLKKWHLNIESLGTAEEATRRFPCPAGAAARRARQRQVNRWHIRDSPSQAPEGGRRPASPPPPRSRGRHWAGAGHIPLHLPSVPDGGKACGGAHLLTVLMPNVQLSQSAGLAASHQQRGAECPGSLFFSRS